MPKKILIIEDDPAIVVSLEFLMLQQGYDVQVTTNAEEGEKTIRQQMPDLILLDINLPQRSGFELCRQLRADSNFDQTRIVLLTAKGREVDYQKGIAFGADEYIIKPFSTRDLVQTVHDLLSTTRNLI
ncbi:MAG: response regulator [SAR324 cluster bacterium]|nr:response regulator [SAR324 cluster bacterium]MBL7035091.1 response regulator [SAR324 cluster bacterium]